MPKVMLVEDDDTMLSLLSTLLMLEGFAVVFCDDSNNLDDLVQFIHQEEPSMILMDVHLRNLNGFDLLRSIRQDSTLKDTRVLMSSGMDVSIRCELEGANGFILKPYMPEELIYKIQQTLEVAK